MKKLTSVVLAMLALPGFLSSAAAKDVALFTVMAGAFDIGKDQTAAEANLQLRFAERLWLFRPHLGVLATTDGGFYGYAGIHADFVVDRVVVTPSIAVGGYSRGSGKDLGGTIQFRSGIEVAYRFDSAARLGVQLAHISHAGIYDRNPGTESLLLTYSVPLTMFGR